MPSQHRFQRSFADDSTLSQRLFALFETCFLGISRAKQHADALGAPWEAASTPFVYFQDGAAISHVGVLEIPLVVMGQAIVVGGIHAVCTRPEFRRRGYYRQVMTEALGYCATRYDTLILTTSQPELYEPFGFRIVGEHVFRNRCASPGGRNGFRILNLQDPGDRDVLHRLLATREPVSTVVGVVHEKAIFCFNEGARPLYYAEDLDLLVCMEVDGTRLKLFDVVASAIPPLAALIERMHQHTDEVEIYFSPDRLDASAWAVPCILDQDGPSFLMVRGPFAAEGRPFMLPRSARC